MERIKETLSKFDAKAVQCAIAELQQEVTTKEIYRIKDQLKAFDSGVRVLSLATGQSREIVLSFKVGSDFSP